MTRVCRFETILPPAPEAFDQQLTFVRDELASMHQEEQISGAFLYGSATAEADTNVGSDIDVVISTPVAATPALADRIRAMTTAVYEQSGIPTDISCFTDDQLSSGSHGYYRKNLLAWLRYQAALFPENVIGRNPADIISPLESDLLQDIDNDLRDYVHLFEMTYMKGHCPDPEGLLETILNFPHKAGRECLSALLLEGLIPMSAVTDARKKSVAVAIGRTLGGHDQQLLPLYSDLVADFDRYTHLVGEVSMLGITQSEYEQLVAETVTADLPKAIELSKRMQTAYRAYLPDRAWPPARSL